MFPKPEAAPSTRFSGSTISSRSISASPLRDGGELIWRLPDCGGNVGTKRSTCHGHDFLPEGQWLAFNWRADRPCRRLLRSARGITVERGCFAAIAHLAAVSASRI